MENNNKDRPKDRSRARSVLTTIATILHLVREALLTLALLLTMAAIIYLLLWGEPGAALALLEDLLLLLEE